MATQDLIDDCCCRILVGNPGADGGLLLKEELLRAVRC